MHPPNPVPDSLLPIGAVVDQLRAVYPEISHSSLRFLEREGLVQSTRTPGGHRLYSRADIDRIRLIKTWQSRRFSLSDIRQRLEQLDRLPNPAQIAATFFTHAVAGNRPAARATVLSADDAGLPLAVTFEEVLRPALVELGSRWEHGTLFVAQEKETSEIARDLIAELSQRHAARPLDGPSLIAACVEGERHELGLRMICGLLQEAGYLVHYLGADVSPQFLLEAVRLHHPNIVLLSARLPQNLAAVGDAITEVRAGVPQDQAPAVVVGGALALAHGAELEAWGALPVAMVTIEAALAVISGAAPSNRDPQAAQR